MIIYIGGRLPQMEYDLVCATHGGIFHPDDVTAAGILEIVFGRRIVLLRSRDEIILSLATIVFDVGGGEFDHHMKGFDECRINGIKYASAGLVWRRYGKEAIKKVAEKYGLSITEYEVQDVFEKIDEQLIIPVDRDDNGESIEHAFSFVYDFYPTFRETEDYDEAFGRAEDLVYQILEARIKSEVAMYDAAAEMKRRLKSNLYPGGILEIPSQVFPWRKMVVEYNEGQNEDNKVNFVIFPYSAGGWAAQCVPPSMAQKNLQRIPFPSSWRGLKDEELERVSRINGATSCHNDVFFARAKQKCAIIMMIIKAIEENG